jgi:hypothetical protein
MTRIALSKRRLGVAIAAVLAADALLHLYWATGARWPATSEYALSVAVLGFSVDFRPGLLIPLALVLLAGAGTVLALVFRPHWLWRVGTGVVTAGLLVRGLLGVVWAVPAFGSVPDGFYWVNLALYTPLCLALGAAGVRLVRRRIPVVAVPVVSALMEGFVP